MEKIIAPLLISILLLAGCQSTPEKPIVVQKDMEQMLDTAQKGTDGDNGKSLKEQYGIPDTYQFEAQGAAGKLNIKVDANVFVPNGNAMPIYKVKAVDFTQEQVTAFWNALIGDTEMWEIQQQQTKEQIQEQILQLKQLMGDEKKLAEKLMDMEDAQKELKALEDRYKAAPERLEERRAYGALEEIAIYENQQELSGKKLATYTGLSVYEKVRIGMGKTFEVQNNNDLKEAVVVRRDEQGNPTYIMPPMSNATINYFDNNIDNTKGNGDIASSIRVNLETELESPMQTLAGLSPKEAIETVQKLLDRTECGMMFDHAFFQKNDGIYVINCTREVEGISVAYIQSGSMADTNEGTRTFWGYETLRLTLNRDGIVWMYWNSPLKITETVNIDCRLKPFAEIKEIFEKMMMVKYEAIAENYDTYTFEIDCISLSLQRIVEQNSIENGLLIPVWNFYGNIIEKNGSQENTKIGESVMSVNAIDGSIIDPAKGY